MKSPPIYDKLNVSGVIIVIDILVCDDNLNVLQQIYKLIKLFEKNNNLSFNIQTKSSADFILQENYHCDIAFIDIEMPGISGLRLAEELKKKNPDVIVIVVTSFQSYLDDAMRIRVFRYLSKPIEPNRFFENFRDALIEYKEISKTIILEIRDEIYSIKTKDILYIENQKHGSILVTKDLTLHTNKKPRELYSMINQPNCFVYSHNSYIVNLQNVIDFNKNTITLRRNREKTVSAYMSQRKYSDFKKAFLAFAGGIR